MTIFQADPPKLSKGMRLILLAASILVLTAGVDLTLLTEQTATSFAWTIQTPITAAFLGAGYLASFLLEFLAYREKTWTHARVAVPSVFLFTVLTLITTILHLDKFHLNSAIFSAVVAAYLWLTIYITVPIALLILLIYQIRLHGSTPKRKAILPTWMRLIIAAQGTIILVTGITLFLSPATASTFWPWELTPLTSRAIGCWLIGIGAIALHMTWENDHQRNRIAYIFYATVGILQAASLVRYVGEVTWSTAGSWIYLLLVISIISLGLYGWKVSRQTASSASKAT
jgi:hypothetical protein